MPRLPGISPESATGETKNLLNGVQAKLGFVPNIMRTLANSPTALDGYLNFSETIAQGTFSATFREKIALAVSQANDCRYCLAAHTAIGKAVGLREESIEDSRRGESQDSREGAALAFAKTVVVRRGRVDQTDVDELRKMGFTDGEFVELMANVALTVFTNYFNHVADTDVDFPAARELEASV